MTIGLKTILIRHQRIHHIPEKSVVLDVFNYSYSYSSVTTSKRNATQRKFIFSLPTPHSHDYFLEYYNPVWTFLNSFLSDHWNWRRELLGEVRILSTSTVPYRHKTDRCRRTRSWSEKYAARDLVICTVQFFKFDFFRLMFLAPYTRFITIKMCIDIMLRYDIYRN